MNLMNMVDAAMSLLPKLPPTQAIMRDVPIVARRADELALIGTTVALSRVEVLMHVGHFVVGRVTFAGSSKHMMRPYVVIGYLWTPRTLTITDAVTRMRFVRVKHIVGSSSESRLIATLMRRALRAYQK